METWKTNLDETKKRYIDWWNHKGIILNMWEHFQEGVKPHADIPAPSPAKDLNQKWFDPQWRAAVSYTHSEPTRLRRISYAVFCLKKKKTKKK